MQIINEIYNANKISNYNKEIFVKKGNLKKQSNNKTLAFYKNENVFIVLSNDSSIELFKILNKKELKARLIRFFMHNKKINYLDSTTEMTKAYKSKNYDHKLKYYSIFKFEDSIKKNKNNSNKKIFNIFLLGDEKFGYITIQNSIEIYKYSSAFLEKKFMK